jgi:hypothetical protein
MAGPTCCTCVYCYGDLRLWLDLRRRGRPLLPRCANHPSWPGQFHDVPRIPCRNHQPRPALPEGDNVRMIPLGDGGYACVDAADYEWLNQWSWHLDDGYAVRCDKGKRIFMHRLIKRAPKGMVIDHRDGNEANNCRSNLRACSRSENSRNRRKRRRTSSVYKGVYYDRHRHKWVAQCFYRGEPLWLGYFDMEAEAARAYDRKAVELFREFARPNFPHE